MFCVTRFGWFLRLRKMLCCFLPRLSELWMGFVPPDSKNHTEMLGFSLRPVSLLEWVKRELFQHRIHWACIGCLQRVFNSAYFRNVPLPASFINRLGVGADLQALVLHAALRFSCRELSSGLCQGSVPPSPSHCFCHGRVSISAPRGLNHLLAWLD